MWILGLKGLKGRTQSFAIKEYSHVVACIVDIIQPQLVTSVKQRRKSLFWASNGLNELPKKHFEFPFNLFDKSTMAFLTGQSWRNLKSWLNKLAEKRFQFPFNLFGKSTMVFLTGQSCHKLKSWLNELPKKRFEFPFMVHTQILVHRWGPRTRISALFCRRT